MSRERGFTLLEVLTSVTICLALCILATSVFFQVRSIMRRTQARLELHNSARFIFQAMRQDLMAMQQEGALYLETTADNHPSLPPNDPGHTGEVRLTFLRGVVDNWDFNNSDDGNQMRSDLVWTQWKYDQRSTSLVTGSSSRQRLWVDPNKWVDPQGHDFGKHTFARIPQPLRAAGTDAVTSLDKARFDPTCAADLGDYQDLAANLQPTTRGVTSFAMEAVLTDGSVVRADTSATTTRPIDGVYVDGRVPASGAKPHLKRPRLLRILFDLSDPTAHLTQSFSFSFQLPSALPPL